ncbi:MAG: hypothetical protein WBK46_12745 [Ruminococcus flavefaciens]
MKKRLFVLCMAAVMLTGCGNAATSGESTADTSSKADTASSAVSDDESQGEASDSSEEEVSEELAYWGNMQNDIEIPYPARYKKGPGGLNNLYIDEAVYYNYDDNENTVYYAETCVPAEKDFDSLDEIFDDFYAIDIKNWLSLPYDGVPWDVMGSIKINTKENEEILGNKAVRAIGSLTTNENKTISFTAHYGLFPHNDVEEGDPGAIYNHPVPMIWIAFTTSNDEKVLDEMNYIADLPLTKARIHE